MSQIDSVQAPDLFSDIAKKIDWAPLPLLGKLATLVASIWIGTKVAAAMTGPQKVEAAKNLKTSDSDLCLTLEKSDSSSKLVALEKPVEEEVTQELTRFQKFKQTVRAGRAYVIATAEAHPQITAGFVGCIVALAVWGVKRQVIQFNGLNRPEGKAPVKGEQTSTSESKTTGGGDSKPGTEGVPANKEDAKEDLTKARVILPISGGNPGPPPGTGGSGNPGSEPEVIDTDKNGTNSSTAVEAVKRETKLEPVVAPQVQKLMNKVNWGASKGDLITNRRIGLVAALAFSATTLLIGKYGPKILEYAVFYCFKLTPADHRAVYAELAVGRAAAARAAAAALAAAAAQVAAARAANHLKFSGVLEAIRKGPGSHLMIARIATVSNVPHRGARIIDNYLPQGVVNRTVASILPSVIVDAPAVLPAAPNFVLVAAPAVGSMSWWRNLFAIGQNPAKRGSSVHIGRRRG